MKVFKGELKLSTGRVVEYEARIGRLIKKLILVDKTGLEETCHRCSVGTIKKYGHGSYTTLGPIMHDTTFGSYKPEEERQFGELMSELKNKK